MNENGDSDAKLHIDQKSACTIDDVEICLTNAHMVFDVNYDGDETNYIESYLGEANFGCYHCRECGESWGMDGLETKAEVWDTVKAHLNE